MSELKRHHINEVMDMHNLTRGEMGYSFVYYADDVDKVIAEKDKKIDLYKRGFEENDKINAYLFSKLLHHKYKRCLAMENWCMTEYLHSKCLDFTNTEQWYWRRWHIRWRNLVKKFKEARR